MPLCTGFDVFPGPMLNICFVNDLWLYFCEAGREDRGEGEYASASACILLRASLAKPEALCLDSRAVRHLVPILAFSNEWASAVAVLLRLNRSSMLICLGFGFLWPD